MKSMLLAVSLLMVGSLSHASDCQELAQLRAKTTVVAKSEYSCKLAVTKVELYLPAQSACPLQLDEILSEGITVSAAGHTCDAPADGVINTLLTKDAYGDIVYAK